MHVNFQTFIYLWERKAVVKKPRKPCQDQRIPPISIQLIDPVPLLAKDNFFPFSGPKLHTWSKQAQNVIYIFFVKGRRMYLVIFQCKEIADGRLKRAISPLIFAFRMGQKTKSIY